MITTRVKAAAELAAGLLLTLLLVVIVVGVAHVIIAGVIWGIR